MFHGLGSQESFHAIRQHYSFRFPSNSPIALPPQYLTAHYMLGLLLYQSYPSLTGVTSHVFRMLLHL